MNNLSEEKIERVLMFIDQGMSPEDILASVEAEDGEVGEILGLLAELQSQVKAIMPATEKFQAALDQIEKSKINFADEIFNKIIFAGSMKNRSIFIPALALLALIVVIGLASLNFSPQKVQINLAKETPIMETNDIIDQLDELLVNEVVMADISETDLDLIDADQEQINSIIQTYDENQL